MQVKSFGQDLEKDHFSYFIPKKNVSTNVIFGKLLSPIRQTCKCVSKKCIAVT